MRIIESRRLVDGKINTHGEKAALIEIETPQDYDTLVANIKETGYYETDYLELHQGTRENAIFYHQMLLASLVYALKPESMLDLGCGRAESLFLLDLMGIPRTRGIDISQESIDQAFSQVRPKILCAGMSDGADILKANGEAFDTIMGLDIWEHLHPGELDRSIASTVSVAQDDAFFLFCIPAHGRDRLFGTSFPLEFEENREAFEAGQPFRFLSAEHIDPPIPAQGHLIWAGTQWWEEQFTSHGLVRAESLEAKLHEQFDRHLSASQRCFYLFRMNTSIAEAREAELLNGAFGYFHTLGKMRHGLRSLKKYEKENNRRIANLGLRWGNDKSSELAMAYKLADHQWNLEPARRLVPGWFKDIVRKTRG
jgi:SAM-dependent methyltransferase